MEKNFSVFNYVFIAIIILYNVSQYDDTLFSFTLFSCLNSATFLHSTLVLSIYIDVVLTHSIDMTIAYMISALLAAQAVCTEGLYLM